jgi:protein TonB
MFDRIDVATDDPSRRWTAIASFTAQAALVGAALVYSLWYPQKISDVWARHHISVPVRWGVVPTIRTAPSNERSTGRALVTPIVVSRGLSLYPRNEPRRGTGVETAPDIPYPAGGTDEGVLNVSTGEAHAIFEHPTTKAAIIRVSSMMPGMLVRRMEPRYPPAAVAARIEGPVKINAIINREGMITQAEVLSGSPLLTGAALAAIRQWRYRPYILNGEPVEVETQITVNFVLGR